jgi:GTP-binding protein HflX
LKSEFRYDESEETKSARAILVGVEMDGAREAGWGIDDSLDELEDLACTAGMVVAGKTSQRLRETNPKTFIGKGKVDEIKQTISSSDASLVIFDDELSPVQNRNLEKIFGDEIRVIDRTALILDIFGSHAHTREGQLQVELAQYEYRLPRLTGLWTHLVRQAGAKALGNVGMRGPGETQLETDRRVIRSKIAYLKKKIEDVRSHRSRQKSGRLRKGMRVVAIVGYTNAGKSSLLNALSNAEVTVENKLFSTLDPTMRRIRLPSGMHVLAADTVGLIKKLPHNLVAAFRATLEGMTEADLILNVADVSHPMVKAQMKVTDEVLKEQGVADTPRLMVWNKADLLSGEEREGFSSGGNVILVSAKTGEGLEKLLAEIEAMIGNSLVEVEAEVPYAEAALLAEVRTQGSIVSISHNDTGSRVIARVPDYLVRKLERYMISG